MSDTVSDGSRCISRWECAVGVGDVYDKLGDREEAIKARVKALEIEYAKPKQEEKLVKSLLGKIPADRIPKQESSEKKEPN